MIHGPKQPAVVGQNVALLPDGSVDPAAATDCGESCVSSVILTYTGLNLSPGCIRQSLAKPAVDGRTNGLDLSRVLRGLGWRARYHSLNPDRSLRSALRYQILRGRYVIMLGSWDSPSVLHWVLAYGFHDHGVWVMDPWPGALREISNDELGSLGAGQIVRVGGRRGLV